MREEDLGEACGLVARYRQRNQFVPRDEVELVAARLRLLGVVLKDQPTTDNGPPAA